MSAGASRVLLLCASVCTSSNEVTLSSSKDEVDQKCLSISTPVSRSLCLYCVCV